MQRYSLPRLSGTDNSHHCNERLIKIE